MTSLPIPQGVSPSRRTIIREYITLREDGRPVSVRHIAETLGYTLDHNNSNTFVLRVIREYLNSVHTRV